MQDFRLEKESAFQNFFFQSPRRIDDFLPGRKRTEALDRRQSHHGIQANGPDNFMVTVHRNELDGTILNARRHVIGHDRVPRLLQEPSQATLQSPPNGMIASKRLGNLPPHGFQFLFPFLQNRQNILLHRFHFLSPQRKEQHGLLSVHLTPTEKASSCQKKPRAHLHQTSAFSQHRESNMKEARSRFQMRLAFRCLCGCILLTLADSTGMKTLKAPSTSRLIMRTAA